MMTTNEAYRAGLLDTLGDDVLGPREPLAYVLHAAEEHELMVAYVSGCVVANSLREGSEIELC